MPRKILIIARSLFFVLFYFRPLRVEINPIKEINLHGKSFSGVLHSIFERRGRGGGWDFRTKNLFSRYWSIKIQQKEAKVRGKKYSFEHILLKPSSDIVEKRTHSPRKKT